MFSWFKKQKEKENWKLVKTFSHEVVGTYTKTEGKLYYHLFESNQGNRKVEFATTLQTTSPAAVTMAAKTMDIYQTKIYRWEQGRLDPEIPRYDQVDEEDLVHALKGKID